MKKTMLTLAATVAITFFACKKDAQESSITLTPSASTVAVGEQLAVSLSTTANVSNWTVSPSATATKAYGLTTNKVNYFSFTQPGTYTIAVRARSIAYDSTSQSLDSCWNHSGGSRGGCTPGVDTVSIAVTVTGK